MISFTPAMPPPSASGTLAATPSTQASKTESLTKGKEFAEIFDPMKQKSLSKMGAELLAQGEGPPPDPLTAEVSEPIEEEELLAEILPSEPKELDEELLVIAPQVLSTRAPLAQGAFPPLSLPKGEIALTPPPLPSGGLPASAQEITADNQVFARNSAGDASELSFLTGGKVALESDLVKSFAQQGERQKPLPTLGQTQDARLEKIVTQAAVQIAPLIRLSSAESLQTPDIKKPFESLASPEAELAPDAAAPILQASAAKATRPLAPLSGQATEPHLMAQNMANSPPLLETGLTALDDFSAAFAISQPLSPEALHRAELQAATRAALAPPVSSQIVHTITTSEQGVTELTLMPEELGRIEIKFSGDSDRLFVTLAGERPETMDLIRRQVDRLISDLRQAGYDDVSVRFDQPKGNPDGRQAHQPAQSDNLATKGDMAETAFANGPLAEGTSPSKSPLSKSFGPIGSLDIRV